MLQFHMEDYSSEISFPLELVFIQDGNALFHSLIYFLSISWYPKKKLFFSTHSHHPDSIKTQEGCQSGCGQLFILEGSGARKVKYFLQLVYVKSYLLYSFLKKKLIKSSI